MQKKEEIDKALVTASSQNSSQSVYQQELVIYLIIKLLLVFAHTSRKCFKDLYLFRLLIQEIVRSGFHTKKKKKKQADMFTFQMKGTKAQEQK